MNVSVIPTPRNAKELAHPVNRIFILFVDQLSKVNSTSGPTGSRVNGVHHDLIALDPVGYLY